MNGKNLVAYLNERFPVLNMALFAVLFGTVYSVARVAGPGLHPGGFGWREGWGMLATISFFFRLRVFDEQKDYALDAVNYPQRVLQSGRVSLAQLATLAGAGAVLELAWSVWMGGPTLLVWLLAVGYSLLMRYEFFAHAYLTKRLLLYAGTHLLIMPFVIGWVWSAYGPVDAPTLLFGLLAGLSLLGGFSFELARKLHTPETERDGVDSYSKSLGYVPTIGAVLGVLSGSVAVQGWLLVRLGAGPGPFGVIGLVYLLTVAVYLAALTRPREKTLKAGEILVSLAMVVSYVSIILTVNG
jgi:hypothetical protein